ncbi:MAG: acetyl-CoA carboxylase biotin carboxyl carrier protein [Bacteroides sp.]|nr:acetyl-CoA carboxylase biotin carboxyl carrier protein [Eubacterium sp.]MCM1418852.1 acetyl-CoA carboxylase biotin carboxyl carrier protein [Roseburia sp.]MCM1462899.1 acetyl-CoA carboxylase biotin carboxyl carrier protein [Bacteroides sp.]
MQYEKEELPGIVKEMIAIMKENDLGHFHVRNDQFEVEFGERIPIPPTPPIPPVSSLSYAGHTVMTHPYEEPASAAEEKPKSERFIKSPLVGTFYAASAPGKAPFVKPGKSVSKGDVVFIIESMKLMNEVKSDQDGVVAEILVADGEAVEYDQPILRLE